MKYVKGNRIFPDKLLREIQTYIQGEYVYIPQIEGARKKWGVKSGQRERLARRNAEIRARFKNGVAIEQLTMTYHLSHETIKKIVYSNKC
ncbi:CD3324 family protein [Paenibacillus septentrionalis]|uniref:CD3324 family protein n=1 Tax=Paenibacillus septentrionalis TaxID=429342 RepID=A0ABW1V2E6_9BACL